jgi:membrane protein DedA with SNARE-associated domain
MTFLQKLWAYITLGAMGFLVEEASPLFGGVQAYDRNLRLSLAILAVALGTWVTGLGLYALGRWQSHSVRKRWPKLRPLVLQAAAIVRRHPWRAALGVRFAFGLRIPLPIACGVARVPVWLFFTASAISCVVWSAIFTLTGFYLAQFAENMIGEVRRYVPMIGTVLVVLMFTGAWWMRRRHVAEKTKRVLDRKPMLTPPTGNESIRP